MNTREIASLHGWDERELQELVARYARTFHRLPSQDQLLRFQRARGWLLMRLPAQRTQRRRRRLTGVLVAR